MKRTLSTYLYILGAVQLLGLNLCGFCWLAWASGIRQAKQSSRRWVIGIHSVYLALCAWGLYQWFFDPNTMAHIKVYGRKVETNPLVVLGFILLLVVIYGLPVLWLMSKRVKQEFMEQSHGEASHI